MSGPARRKNSLVALVNRCVSVLTFLRDEVKVDLFCSLGDLSLVAGQVAAVAVCPWCGAHFRGFVRDGSVSFFLGHYWIFFG